jgi:hypothetical protein
MPFPELLPPLLEMLLLADIEVSPLVNDSHLLLVLFLLVVLDDILCTLVDTAGADDASAALAQLLSRWRHKVNNC